LAPDAGEGWGGLSIGHVVSRSVRDSALMLDCTAGAEPGDPYTAPPPERSFVQSLGRPPKKLKIAMSLTDHRGGKLHSECAKAVAAAAKLCAQLGHTVDEVPIAPHLLALRPMNSLISAANAARALGLRWKALGREPNSNDVEAVTWAVYQRGLKAGGAEYVEAIAPRTPSGASSPPSSPIATCCSPIRCQRRHHRLVTSTKSGMPKPSLRA